MHGSRFGSVLLGIGVAVGVAAVIGVVTGFEPSRLPPALLDIAVYKLTFTAAAGLLAAGAIVRRYARRDAAADDSALAAERASNNAERALPPPRADAELSRRADARSKVEVQPGRRGDSE